MSDSVTYEDLSGFQERFAHLLKTHREVKNFKQSELARRLGVSVPLIAKFESLKCEESRAISSYEFFKRLANVLGQSYTELAAYLDTGGHGDTESPWTEPLMRVLPHLGSDIQHQILYYMSKTSLKIVHQDMKFFVEYINMTEDSKRFVEEVVRRTK